MPAAKEPSAGCWENIDGEIHTSSSQWLPQLPFSVYYSLAGNKVGENDRELIQGMVIVEAWGHTL
jgi:hypothetical protein